MTRQKIDLEGAYTPKELDELIHRLGGGKVPKSWENGIKKPEKSVSDETAIGKFPSLFGMFFLLLTQKPASTNKQLPKSFRVPDHIRFVLRFGIRSQKDLDVMIGDLEGSFEHDMTHNFTSKVRVYNVFRAWIQMYWWTLLTLIKLAFDQTIIAKAIKKWTQ